MGNSKNTVNVAFTRNELWNLLKMFHDGEHVFISVALHEKLMCGYLDQLRQSEKNDKAEQQGKQKSTGDIIHLTNIPKQIIDNTFHTYIEMIAADKNIKSYEPIDYRDFIKLLNDFCQHYEISQEIYFGLPIEAIQERLQNLKEMLAEEEAHCAEIADLVGEDRLARSTARTTARMKALETAIKLWETLTTKETKEPKEPDEKPADADTIQTV